MSHDEMWKHVEPLHQQLPDLDERVMQRVQQLVRIYSCDLASEQVGGTIDAHAQEETWNDMLRLQREGIYPAVFKTTGAPIVMLHGAEETHLTGG